MSDQARENVALLALEQPDGDWAKPIRGWRCRWIVQTFEALFGVFESRRDAIAAFVEARRAD